MNSQHENCSYWPLGFAVALAAPASAQQLRMMTGPQGGSWIPLGGQLKDLWEKAIPGTNIAVACRAPASPTCAASRKARPTSASRNSISAVDALAGKAPFNKPHANVCNVATLYPQYTQFVVLADAGINKIADLKGKSITTQQRGNTGELITRQFLEANGLSYSDVKVSFVGYTDSVNQMKDGHAVAFGLTTQIPAGAIMDLAAARDIKLIDQSDVIDKMRKHNAGYKLITIPKGTYPKQDKDVQVIGFFTHIVASCKLPERHGLHDDQDDRRQHQDAGDRRQGHRLAHAEGHGPGHRGAVPSRRREVLQGSRHHGEDALIDRAGAGIETRAGSRFPVQPRYPVGAGVTA